MAATTDGGGYWLVAANGHVFSYGDAPQLSRGTGKLKSPVVGSPSRPQDTGAWLAEQNGTVLSLGTATAHGSLSGVTTPVTRHRRRWCCPPPSTLAYDLAEANGKVAALGKAAYYGSAYGKHLVAPIVALVPTPDRKGYWLIGADGSVYAFGDAKYEGGAGGRVRQDPIVAAAATPDGRGYWLVTANGRVLDFGDAPGYGSVQTALHRQRRRHRRHARRQGVLDRCRSGQGLQLRRRRTSTARPGSNSAGQAIVAMAATPDGGGYWLARANGNVARFGDAVHLAPARRRSRPSRPSSAWPSPPTGRRTGWPSRTARS